MKSKSEKLHKTFAKEEGSSPNAHSITNVNPSRKHGVGCWGNSRKVVGIRVDEGLYLAFKPVAKRVFGSTCRAVESFMATIVACCESGVNFGNTVDIKEIRIERNLRSRRALPQIMLGNFYDGNMWYRVDEPFNENGHGLGCKCRICYGRPNIHG